MGMISLGQRCGVTAFERDNIPSYARYFRKGFAALVDVGQERAAAKSAVCGFLGR